MFKPEDFDKISTYLLAKEAARRGIKVSKIFPKTQKSFLRLELGKEVQTIIGQRIMNMSFNAYFVCKNKEMTRMFLKKENIKTTEGEYFKKSQLEEAFEYINKVGYPVVIKPVDDFGGRDVYLNIQNHKQVKKDIIKVLKNSYGFLVEKHFIGKEYRFLATRDKLLGVVNRIPANVFSDGESTIGELIKIKNKDPQRGDGPIKDLVKIKIDKAVIAYLQELNLSLDFIPKKDEHILLRKNSNISTGGDSIDITDDVHPKFKTLAPKIVRAIPGLPYAGFDLITQDVTQDPEKVEYAVVEVNSSPGIGMHHEPFQGKKRNVAKEIIDLAFPETKDQVK